FLTLHYHHLNCNNCNAVTLALSRWEFITFAWQGRGAITPKQTFSTLQVEKNEHTFGGFKKK
ncbi:MAG: hypothetical protein IIZ97_04120, partial [Prevotella sp.]|nr:hypothetical protein [Prevotella sp.]